MTHDGVFDRCQHICHIKPDITQVPDRGQSALKQALETLQYFYHDKILTPAPAFITAQYRICADIFILCPSFDQYFSQCCCIQQTHVGTLACEWVRGMCGITNQGETRLAIMFSLGMLQGKTCTWSTTDYIAQRVDKGISQRPAETVFIHFD